MKTLCRRCSREMETAPEPLRSWLCEACAATQAVAARYLALREVGAPKACAMRMAVEALSVPAPEWPSNRPFLLLVGQSGTGKSTAAAALLQTHRMRRGGTPLFVDMREFMERRKLAIDSKEHADPVEAACYAPGLVLDDLGAEPARQFSRETVELIVGVRYNEMSPTVITTNLATMQGERVEDVYGPLADRYGVTVAERITEWSRVVPMLTYHREERGKWLERLPAESEHFERWKEHTARHEAASLEELILWEAREHEVPDDARAAYEEDRRAHPRESFETIREWMAGRSYDPAKDEEFLASLK